MRKSEIFIENVKQIPTILQQNEYLIKTIKELLDGKEGMPYQTSGVVSNNYALMIRPILNTNEWIDYARGIKLVNAHTGKEHFIRVVPVSTGYEAYVSRDEAGVERLGVVYNGADLTNVDFYLDSPSDNFFNVGDIIRVEYYTTYIPFSTEFELEV